MRHRRAWLIAIAALALFTALTAAYPIFRTFADFDIKFNEGWNATRATMVLRGIPLYGAPPQYTITNYPPLPFHLIALAARLTGDVNAADRYVSLLSLAAIAMLIAAIVRRFAALHGSPDHFPRAPRRRVEIIEPHRRRRHPHALASAAVRRPLKTI